jgi:hypothetical protein
MRLWITLALIAYFLGIATGAQTSATTVDKSGRNDKDGPPYATDPRFDRPVRFGGVLMVGARVLQALSRDTGADLVVADTLLRFPLDGALDGRPAREAMDALAEPLAGKWVKAGKAYVLTVDPRLLEAMLLDENEREGKTKSVLTSLIGTLPNQTLRALQSGKRLPLESRLGSLSQKELLSELGRLALATPPLRPPPSVLQGEGFELRQISGSLELWVQTALRSQDKVGAIPVPSR